MIREILTSLAILHLKIAKNLSNLTRLRAACREYSSPKITRVTFHSSMQGNCPAFFKWRWYGVRARVVTLTLTLGTCDPLIPRFISIQLYLMWRVIPFPVVVTVQNRMTGGQNISK